MSAAPNAIDAGSTAWMLVSTALVMLMVPGLALSYGGLVRGKSVLNTMLMSLAALGAVTVQWVVSGYSLAFAGALTVGILGVLRLVVPLRVPVADEIDGVDLSEHGESAYHGDDADLAGRGVPLGGSVYLPTGEVAVFDESPAAVRVA